MSTLGSRIRESREKKNMSQSDLAESVGSRSKAVVSQWEGDVSRPDVDRLVAIARTLEVPVAYLLDCYVGIPGQVLLSDEQVLIEKYRALDERGRRKVDECLKEQADRCRAGIERSVGPHFRASNEVFLAPGDNQFDTMKKAVPLLDELMKETQVSFGELATFLWGLGYAGMIGADDLESVMIGEKIPSTSLYLAILSYLKIYAKK